MLDDCPASPDHMTQSVPAPSRTARLGRPRAQEVGLVDGRILAAATSLFMEQGFGRTTMDQVSALSKTGKSTLYKRYPGKEDLFSAVVQRSIGLMFSDIQIGSLENSPARRLRHVGYELARNLLLPRCVKLMRIIAAESENFPELAKVAYQASSIGCIRSIEAALRGPDETAGKIADMDRLARRFMELALQPTAFQAIMGGDHQDLGAKSVAAIDDTIALLIDSGRLPA
jgi:AcrR family transcriptional regulator